MTGTRLSKTSPEDRDHFLSSRFVSGENGVCAYDTKINLRYRGEQLLQFLSRTKHQRACPARLAGTNQLRPLAF